jgi:DNA/RNA-binding domain of Phe-tRNA-synthetase-like protein
MNAPVGFVMGDDAIVLGITGAYFVMRGLVNREEDRGFEAVKEDRLSRILEQLTEESIEKDEVLNGFRELHRRVDKASKKNMSSPENLLRSLLRNSSLPHVNLLVDIYNLVSVETRLALGAHDINNIAGSVTLRLTDGTEKFFPLGYGRAKPVGKKEYAYIDDDNDVICWLEVRQVEKTKVLPTTTDAFYIVQGNAQTASDVIRSATEELIALTKRYCGGQEELLWVPW